MRNSMESAAVSRPTNASQGRQSRSERIPVQVTPDEKEELEKAAAELGLGVSTYMRLKALEAARSDG